MRVRPDSKVESGRVRVSVKISALDPVKDGSPGGHRSVLRALLAGGGQLIGDAHKDRGTGRGD